MGRKLRADQLGVFPGVRPDRFYERDRVVSRELAKRAGLPNPDELDGAYQNLGNRELPIFAKKGQIQHMVRDNPISMLEGDTGSGKSTQLGQYALEMGYEKIIYLEGRVLLADNLADRIEQELSDQLGPDEGRDLIGVRHSERSTGRGKRIEVMTPDTFIRVFHELSNYEDKPVLVIGDEIHEKDFATELGVAAMAQHLDDHPKWRLALVSATLDADAIQEAYSRQLGHDVPIVSVEGRPYDLSIIEEPTLTATQAYRKYSREHQKAQIFVAGKQEIKDTIDELTTMQLGRVRITPLHAKLSRAAIRQATHAELDSNEKQVIPSTNAGQSGITIPGQTLVIADGVVRRPDLDLDGVEGLFKQYAARDEMIQAGGRAGRDVDGGVMVIVRPDDEDFDFIPLAERRAHSPAQIYHTNISRNVLAVTVHGFDFYELNKWLINGVKKNRILEAYDTLYRLGAIDGDNNPTKLGIEMSRLPVRPEFSRSIIEAFQNSEDKEVVYQLVGMASAIEAGGMPYFEKGVGEAWRADIRKSTNDDFVAQLDMFKATRRYYDGVDVDEAALEAKNYDMKNVRRAHRSYDKILRALGLSGDSLPGDPTDEQLELIRMYLTAGFFDLAHRRTEPDEQSREANYVSLRRGGRRRALSDRGTYRGDESFVLGMPRRFEKRRSDGGKQEFSVIENVAPTTEKNIAKYALWLADREELPSQIVGGRILRLDRLMFGDLELGTRESSRALPLSERERKLLINETLNGKTHTISMLKETKASLEWLAQFVPDDEIDHYFPDGIMTQDWLIAQISSAIKPGVYATYEIDLNLRNFVTENDIAMEAWIDQDKAEEILSRSPNSISIGSNKYSVYYSHGKPVINHFNLVDADALPDTLQLDDGREVLITYQIGRNAKQHHAFEIKDYAHELDG